MMSLLFGIPAVLITLCIAYFIIKAGSTSLTSTMKKQMGQEDNIPDEVRRMALDPSKKIQAIKMLRDANPGMGLASAKLQVEALRRGSTPATAPTGGPDRAPAVPHGWTRGQAPQFSSEAERLAMDPNNKIAAIKILREENPGLGLADAKQAVEGFYAAHRSGMD